MNPKHISLAYSVEAGEQSGAAFDNDLFELLAAVHEHGSISHAAVAMKRSYRYTWGELRRWEQVLGQPLVDWVQGQRAKLTPYAQRLLWAERQTRVRMTPHLEALRAQLRHVFAVADDPHLEVLDVCASHDLGLPQLQSIAAGGKLHLDLKFAGSQEALRALNDGRCDVAGFHVPPLVRGSEVFTAALRGLLEPGRHKLIGSHRRLQGFMFRKADPRAGSLQETRDLADGRWRFVNRQPGSGTRMLMDHLLHEAGMQPEAIAGYLTHTENTHVAVAASVAAGAADAGLGIEAAARAFGLDFAPVVQEDYFLVCLKPALESAAVRRLRGVLASAGWRDALTALPGYQPQRPGQVLSLTRALPWWQFATAKPSVEGRASRSR
jgi:putative molybdopterin biosynthesis protein